MIGDIEPRPLLMIAIGVIGGIIVGMTSVGSGSLMIVLLLFAYPALGAKQPVGTDLTQAVPLTLAGALGALAFNHVEFGVTTTALGWIRCVVLLGAGVLWLMTPRPRRDDPSSLAHDRPA